MHELPEPLYGLGLVNAEKALPALPPRSPARPTSSSKGNGRNRDPPDGYPAHPPPSPGYPTPQFELTLRGKRDVRSARRESADSVDTITGASTTETRELERRREMHVKDQTEKGKGKVGVKQAMSRLFTRERTTSSSTAASTPSAPALRGSASTASVGGGSELGEATSKKSVKSLPFLRRKKYSNATTTSSNSHAHTAPNYSRANSPSAERALREQALAYAKELRPKSSTQLQQLAATQRLQIDLPLDVPAVALFTDEELFKEKALPTEDEMREAAEMEVVDENGRRWRFGDLWDREEEVGAGRTVVCFIRHFW